jgi:phosphatidylglycerophosphate synthase
VNLLRLASVPFSVSMVVALRFAAAPSRTQRVFWPAGAMAGLSLLLAALVAAGLGPAGLAAGVAAGAVLVVLLHRVRPAGLSPADVVTLVRAVLGCGVTALVVDGSTGLLLAATVTVALLLDGVDGAVARRTGTASAAGARFDMEVDAALILVLSVHAAAVLGPWVLAIGGMRYGFVAAGRLLPWLRGSLPPSLAAKAIAVVAGGALLAVAAGLRGPGAVALAGLALALLCWSFGRSVVQLARARRVLGHHWPVQQASTALATSLAASGGVTGGRPNAAGSPAMSTTRSV